MAEGGALWMSKDRFAAKRLGAIGREISPAKRAVIEQHSAFRALLNVSPFNIPNELIDYVALHTTPQLREFKHHKKRIVFTRDMVKKVYGVRCGNRPVELLKKSETSELRDIYKSRTNSRPDIATVVTVLKTCADTDEVTILRTWDLLSLATVVDPGSGNMCSLDYLASMADPRRTEEFAWDEHLLDLAMAEVEKIQKKKKEPLVLPAGSSNFEFWISGPFAMLGIVYMDHLLFPPNVHAFNYSVPRVCFVTTNDFKFVVANDIDRKILKNTTVFGWRPFLELANTPYVVVGNQPVNQPVEEHIEQPAEDGEVNASASLNEWLVFPTSQDLEVPARFKHLHDKHKALFAADLESSSRKFVAGVKSMHSIRMAALLIDVEAAMAQEDVPDVVFSAEQGGGVEEHTRAGGDGAGDKENCENVEKDDDSEATKDEVLVEPKDDQDIAAKESTLEAGSSVASDVPKPPAVLVESSTGGDAGEDFAVISPARSPFMVRSPRKDISDAAWNAAPDPPSMDLFAPGTEDYVWLQEGPSALTESTPVVDQIVPKPPTVAPAETTKIGSINLQGEETSDAPPSVTIISPPSVKKQAVDGSTTESVTPVVLKKDVSTVSNTNEKDVASTGNETLEKRNRAKRALKPDATPPKEKKIKVSQEHGLVYDKFLGHGKNLKRISTNKKENQNQQKCFVRFGRLFCTYRAFFASFKPRKCLDSEVMCVWTEKFNNISKACADKSSRARKKYAFATYFTEKLIVDPATFNPSTVMKDFKEACSKFKIFKDDLILFPIVYERHWVVATINLLYKQFHLFDSLLPANGVSKLEKQANNLFSNFVRTANKSKLCSIDFSTFNHFTPKHSQQKTLFDCGFYSIFYMDNFNGKIMVELDFNSVPNYRKSIAANMIETRDNHEDNVEEIMKEHFQD